MRPRKLTEAMLTDIALTVGANPKLRPKELDELIVKTFKISISLAREARAALKRRMFVPAIPNPSSPVPHATQAAGTPVHDKMPENPLDARQTIIDSLYDQMQSAARPDDRIKAGKELARLLGYHREDMQDALSGISKSKEDDIAKCRRIQNNLRKALGLPEDEPQRDVPEVRIGLAAGSQPAEAVPEVPANRN